MLFSQRVARASLFSALLALTAAGVAAQQRQMPPGIEDLPIGLSPAEAALVGTIGTNSFATSPPTGPVWAAPEWEESEAVFCLWNNANLMLKLQENGNQVIIISQNPSWWTNWLSSNGIPTGNFSFLSEPTNTWWVRDYGPWFIWDGNGDFGLVDNVYNRPRPLDDVIPGAIASTYGVPYYSMDVIHTGGNYYTDGYGTAFSSRLVYKENPSMTEAEVDQDMADYLGIWRYATQELDYDIEHFDTFGKPVAPDTLVWGEFPDQTTPWAYSEAALKRYQKLQSPYGWPYKVHRLPLWSYGGSWTAYVNSLQTNNRFIVPKYNTGNDSTAQGIFEAAAPGYEVVLASAGGTSWGDSIHCRTRNFVRGDTIRIYPAPHWERTDDTVNPYEVSAQIFPDNSTSLSGSPTLYWSTTGGAPFNSEAMLPTGNPDEYSAGIPAHAWGTVVSYYIHAEDLLGTTKDFPFTAPDGLFTITVAEDTDGPDLDHDVIHGLTLADWPVTVEAVAIDDTGIPELLLEYEIDGNPQPPVPMVKETGTFRFSGQMTGSVSLGDVITYRVTATDGATPANTSSSPGSGWNFFTIDAANRVLVVELDESHDSGDLLVDVCDDLGLNVQYTDAWPSSLGGYETLMICLGMTPTKTGLTTAQANQLVNFLSSGGTAYMEGGNTWAQDSARTIYNPYFGVNSASNGTNITTNVVGVTGQFTAGMTFGYEGEAKNADHLTPSGSATGVLRVSSQNKALTNSTGTYSTVASSFQVGCLVDSTSPSHTKLLVGEYLKHLDLGISFIAHPVQGDPTQVYLEIEGDPGARYRSFYSPSPGLMNVGIYGVLLIDRATLGGLATGTLDGNGQATHLVGLPPGAMVNGEDVYLQVFLEDTGTGLWHLTNRDRIQFD